MARVFRHGNVPGVTVGSGRPIRPGAAFGGTEASATGRRATVTAMATVPLDEGYPGRRRVGPFWIEEGVGLVIAGAVLLVAVIALYVLAVAHRPH